MVGSFCTLYLQIHLLALLVQNLSCWLTRKHLQRRQCQHACIREHRQIGIAVNFPIVMLVVLECYVLSRVVGGDFVKMVLSYV